MNHRELFNGPDGQLRARIYPGDGEFVCVGCDAIDIAPAMPPACASCGHERMETLTAVMPPTWPLEMLRG